jgi:hypothetical protein
LYKAWSGAKQLVRCATFQEGGFSFPLNLELDDKSGPAIYTNNHHSIFRYSILSGRSEKLLEIENSRLISGVVKHGKNFYYLTQETAANAQPHLTLNSSSHKHSYPLGNYALPGSSASPLQCIGDDLWVITREKVFLFRNFPTESPKEFSWNPWRLWPTSKGLLYSEKVRAGIAGNTQSIWRLSFGGAGFEHYSLASGLSLTTQVAASEDGQTVLFTYSGIEVFDAAMNSVEELTGIVQVHNPQGILLSRPFIFWFETSDRSVRAWEIGESKVYSLWSFTGENVNFSEFLLSGSSLYGFTEEEVRRWDLLGS